MFRWCKIIVLLITLLMLVSGCSGTKLNMIPEANLIPQEFVLTGSTVHLDGSNSIDPDGMKLTYSWTIESKPENSSATLTGADTAKPSFIADKSGVYLVALVVNDGFVSSAPVIQCINASKGYQRLNYEVIDAGYSKTLDKLIMISKNPEQLHIYSPTTGAENIVDLPLTPESVSLSPDGLFAIVSHDMGMSYIDLTTESLLKLIPYDNYREDLIDILLSAEFAYVLTYDTIYQVNLLSGVTHEVPTSMWYMRGQVHPDGKSMYVHSSNRTAKYDITGGQVSFLYEVSGNYSYGGAQIWIADTGSILISHGGSILKLSEKQSEDLQTLGQIQVGDNFIISADIAESKNIGYAIRYSSYSEDQAQNSLYMYSLSSFDLINTVTLPLIYNGSTLSPSRGKFVFTNSKQDQVYVITQFHQTAQLENDYSVVIY